MENAEQRKRRKQRRSSFESRRFSKKDAGVILKRGGCDGRFIITERRLENRKTCSGN